MELRVWRDCLQARSCAPLGLLYSTAGWQGDERMSMGGDLTSTDIPILLLLEHLSATPPDHRGIQAPLLIPSVML